MQNLIARLQQEKIQVNTELTAEIKALWFWGIERISNSALKTSLIEYYRTVVPWQFFVSPSSATGKYHPPHHNRKGGIVRHLAECCILAPRLLQMYGFSEKNNENAVLPDAQDTVIAATLISDTFKNGNPWGERTKPEHGKIASEAWLPVADRIHVAQSMQDAVYHATYWHLGRFTPNDPRHELTDLPILTQIVHLLDSFSSCEKITNLYVPVPKIQTE